MCEWLVSFPKRLRVASFCRWCLDTALSRPVTALDNERFTVQSVMLHYAVPVVLVREGLLAQMRACVEGCVSQQCEWRGRPTAQCLPRGPALSLYPSCSCRLAFWSPMPCASCSVHLGSLPGSTPFSSSRQGWALLPCCASLPCSSLSTAQASLRLSPLPHFLPAPWIDLSFSPADGYTAAHPSPSSSLCGSSSLGSWVCFTLPQVNGMLPILPLLFPVLWVLATACGEARVLAQMSKASPSSLVGCSKAGMESSSVVLGSGA